jgi:hypothetical protein
LQGKSEIEADVASSEQIDQATNQVNLAAHIQDGIKT